MVYALSVCWEYTNNGNRFRWGEPNANIGTSLKVVADAATSSLQNENTAAKLTNDIETQVKVGAAQWVVNGLYTVGAILGSRPDANVTTLKVGSRGCAAPLSKEELAENKAAITPPNYKQPILNDLNTLMFGRDIAEKTTSALNLGAYATIFMGGEASAASTATRDMSWGRVPLGPITIESAGIFSESEIAAAQYMRGMGNKVELRMPQGTRAGGQTSDLLVNGIRYDVYTPISKSPKSIISAMAKKNTQTTGIVLDLSKTTVKASDLGNALKRVNNAGAKNIKDIKIIPKKL